jgi:predicted RNase H-like HicB family nuclease
MFKYRYEYIVFMRLVAVVMKEGVWYSAWCPDLDIASQGKTIESALENLREAIELYLEDEDADLVSKSPLLTTIEVHSHGKAPNSLRIENY